MCASAVACAPAPAAHSAVWPKKQAIHLPFDPVSPSLPYKLINFSRNKLRRVYENALRCMIYKSRAPRRSPRVGLAPSMNARFMVSAS